MSNRCYVDKYEEGLYATYKGATVRLVEKLQTNSSIWIVENIETDELKIAYEYNLDNLYYNE